MMDSGIVLLGRSVCGAVGSPVSYRHTTDGPGWPPLPAGADELEGVAVDRVAADPSVFDTEAATYYGHGVQHTESVFLSALEKLPPPPGWKKTEPRGESVQAELVRRARLSRWQEQR